MKLSENAKNAIVNMLAPLEPEKIILFGSYAWGEPTDDSDIDIFLLKDMPVEEVAAYTLAARRRLRGFIADNRIGVDVFADSKERVMRRIKEHNDHFYKDIVENGVYI